MLFGYLQAIGVGGVYMASVNSQCVRQSLLSSVYFRANRGCARRKIFKMEVLRRLKNTVFRMVVVVGCFL